jgi:hypothetical protein
VEDDRAYKFQQKTMEQCEYECYKDIPAGPDEDPLEYMYCMMFCMDGVLKDMLQLA